MPAEVCLRGRLCHCMHINGLYARIADKNLFLEFNVVLNIEYLNLRAYILCFKKFVGC